MEENIKSGKAQRQGESHQSFQKVSSRNILVCDLYRRGFILSVVSDPRLESKSNRTKMQHVAKNHLYLLSTQDILNRGFSSSRS